MSATPRPLGPLCVVNGRVRTPLTARGGAIVIGSAFIPTPPPQSRDADAIQASLLETRPACARPLFHRIAGAIWRWC